MSITIGIILGIIGLIPIAIVWDAYKKNRQSVPFGWKTFVAGIILFIIGMGITVLDNDFILGVILLIIAIGAAIYSGFYIKGWLKDNKHPGFIRSGGVAAIALLALVLGTTGMINGHSDKASESSNPDNMNTSQIMSSESKQNSENNAKANKEAKNSKGVDTTDNSATTSNDHDGKVYDKYTKQYETKGDQKAIDSTIEDANKSEKKNFNKLNNSLAQENANTKGMVQSAYYDKHQKMTIVTVGDSINNMVGTEQEAYVKTIYNGITNVINNNGPYPNGQDPSDWISIRNDNGDILGRTTITGKFKYFGN